MKTRSEINIIWIKPCDNKTSKVLFSYKDNYYLDVLYSFKRYCNKVLEIKYPIETVTTLDQISLNLEVKYGDSKKIKSWINYL